MSKRVSYLIMQDAYVIWIKIYSWSNIYAYRQKECINQ